MKKNQCQNLEKAAQNLLVNVRWLIPMLSFSLAGLLLAVTLPYLKRELTKKYL